jgi:hypothetical protein
MVGDPISRRDMLKGLTAVGVAASVSSGQTLAKTNGSGSQRALPPGSYARDRSVALKTSEMARPPYNSGREERHYGNYEGSTDSLLW